MGYVTTNVSKFIHVVNDAVLSIFAFETITEHSKFCRAMIAFENAKDFIIIYIITVQASIIKPAAHIMPWDILIVAVI